MFNESVVLFVLILFMLADVYSSGREDHDCVCVQGRRRAEFVDVKRQIILCMEDLDQLPETSFEKDFVCEDEDAFCLSRENITSLKLLLCQVSQLVKSWTYNICLSLILCC